MNFFYDVWKIVQLIKFTLKLKEYDYEYRFMLLCVILITM